MLSSCCRRLCTDLKKDSCVDGCAGWAVVLLGAARVEPLVGVLPFGSAVVAASSRIELPEDAVVDPFALEDGALALFAILAGFTSLVEPDIVLLVLF